MGIDKANVRFVLHADVRDGSVALAGPPDPEDMTARALERAACRRRVDQSKVEMMRGYAETTGCRRQYLLGYFGERLPAPSERGLLERVG